MTILLVDLPSGEQKEISVKQGGAFHDSSAVIWDERNDGALPAIDLGGMVKSGNTLIFDQTRKNQHDSAVALRVSNEEKEKATNELKRISQDAIPDILQWVASQPSAPQAIKDKNGQADIARGKL